jgi:hypothetical protein
MTPEQFALAVESLKGYYGVVGVFGGNPAVSKHFMEICKVLRDSWVPYEQRGIWSNNPITADRAVEMRRTFNPRVSNLNVHMDLVAHTLFRTHWPESMPCGLDRDSRHSPPWIAMKDVLLTDCPVCGGSGRGMTWVDDGDPCYRCEGKGKVYAEEEAWDLISRCDINQHWSAGIGVFRGQLRAYFCEVAMAQALLHQHEPDYPDTGVDLEFISRPGSQLDHWWKWDMGMFANQVRQHCHSCGVPLRGYGQLAQSKDPNEHEQVSATHKDVYRLKDKRRPLQLVTERSQVQEQRLDMMTRYLQNSSK